MKFTVDRKMWYRGKGSDGSMLLRHDDTMCCLGFLGRACGIFSAHLDQASSFEEMMVDGYDPADVVAGLPHTIAHVSDDGSRILDSKLTGRIIAVNDDETMNDDDREVALFELFLEGGIQVEFVG